MIRWMMSMLLVLLAAGTVYSAPFMVCDPYPLTDNQPEEFVIQVGVAEIRSPAVKNANGQVYMSYDLAAVKGAYKGTVRAYAVQWGYSDPVPFDFNIGLGKPSNIRIQMEGPMQTPAKAPGPSPKLKSPSTK